MIVPLLAGAAKTLVISMLSERVLLRVLVMLSEWAAAKSTNSLDAFGLRDEDQAGSGWETLMLLAYTTPDISSCLRSCDA